MPVVQSAGDVFGKWGGGRGRGTVLVHGVGCAARLPISVHDPRNGCSRCPELLFAIGRNERSRWPGIRIHRIQLPVAVVIAIDDHLRRLRFEFVPTFEHIDG